MPPRTVSVRALRHQSALTAGIGTTPDSARTCGRYQHSGERQARMADITLNPEFPAQPDPQRRAVMAQESTLSPDGGSNPADDD